MSSYVVSKHHVFSKADIIIRQCVQLVIINITIRIILYNFVDVDPNLASSEVFAKTGSKLELAQYLGLEKKKN